jgi:hypothetical protein
VTLKLIGNCTWCQKISLFLKFFQLFKEIFWKGDINRSSCKALLKGSVKNLLPGNVSGKLVLGSDFRIENNQSPVDIKQYLLS